QLHHEQMRVIGWRVRLERVSGSRAVRKTGDDERIIGFDHRIVDHPSGTYVALAPKEIAFGVHARHHRPGRVHVDACQQIAAGQLFDELESGFMTEAFGPCRLPSGINLQCEESIVTSTPSDNATPT